MKVFSCLIHFSLNKISANSLTYWLVFDIVKINRGCRHLFINDSHFSCSYICSALTSLSCLFFKGDNCTVTRFEIVVTLWNTWHIMKKHLPRFDKRESLENKILFYCEIGFRNKSNHFLRFFFTLVHQPSRHTTSFQHRYDAERCRATSCVYWEAVYKESDEVLLTYCH